MSFIKFSNADIVYEVNYTKNTVTAYINSFDVDDNNMRTALSVLLINNIKIPALPKMFVATARCKQGDVFNVEKGKRVARLKLLRKITQAERTYTRYIYDKYTLVTQRVSTALVMADTGYSRRLNNLCAYLDKE